VKYRAVSLLVVSAAAMAAGFLAATAWNARCEAPKGEAPLPVRLAQAHVQLAETNLKIVRRSNRRAAGAVPANVVGQYQEDLALAKVRLQHALGQGGVTGFRVWLRAAEAASNAAQDDWQSARAANQSTPGIIDDLEVERLHLRAEVARLRLELGASLADKPQEEQVQWQMTFLLDEVQQLQERVIRSPSSATVEPFWPY